MRVCKHGCDDKDVLLFARLACKHELRDECLSQMYNEKKHFSKLLSV